MSHSAPRKSKSFATQSAELAMAVPQVVAHRVARMALSGPAVSARDRKEFNLMVSEKQTAFAQAWTAMAVQTVRAHQALAASFMRNAWTPGSWGQPASTRLAMQAQDAAWGILGKGIGPLHLKTMANAKRLGRTRLK